MNIHILRFGILFTLAIFLNSSAAVAQPALPTSPGIPLNWWKFDDTNFLSVFNDAPMSMTNVESIPSWDGNAAQLDLSNSPARLRYRIVESDGWTNVSMGSSNGSFRMWFKPNWDSGDTNLPSFPRLLEIGSCSSNTEWLALYFDSVGSNILFSAQNTNNVQTNYLSSPITLDSNTWTLVTLTWSSSNTCLFLNDQLAATGDALSIRPGAATLTNGFFIGSDSTGSNQCRGQVENLRTFNYALSAEFIGYYFAVYSSIANPPPFGMGVPELPEGGGGEGGGDPGQYQSFVFDTNGLWLEVLPLGTNIYNTNTNDITILLHNTISDIAYQLLSATNLGATNIVWTIERDLLGAPDTNLTATSVSMTNRPTVYFRALAYTLDTDGDGLPDWWQLEQFGHLGVDAYGDPDGDGWANIEEYQQGTNPNHFDTPRGPTGFTAKYNTNGTLTLTWSPAPNLPTNGAGAVTGYSIYFFGTNVTVGPSQTNYEFNATNYPYLEDWFSYYLFFPDSEVQVNYAGTNSLWSGQPGLSPKYSVEAYIVRGAQGRLTLVASSVPPDVKAIRVWPLSYFTFVPFGYYLQPETELSLGSADFFDIPVTNLTNGIYVIPDAVLPLYGTYQFMMRAIGNDGTLGPAPSDMPYRPWVSSTPFLDGRPHLRQNLDFLLQAATKTAPFEFIVTDTSGHYRPHAFPNTYAYSSFHKPLEDGYGYYYAHVNEFMPFDDNYFYHNFLFQSTDLNSNGSFATGPYYISSLINGIPIRVGVSHEAEYRFDAYSFVANTNTNPPSAILTNWQWNYYPREMDLADIDVFKQTSVSPQLFYLSNNQVNLFGLPYQSAKRAYAPNNLDTLSTGNTLSDLGQTYYFYPATERPILSTGSYYFGRPGIDLLPGHSDFTVTNATASPMITTVGQPFLITAWAKRTILNNYPSVNYAYQEEYFDKAYKLNTNGVVTTNTTGVLSPYGEFFPTESGPIALVTMADTNGLRGTNIIHVIAMNVDGNHDGVMDFSFNGPDFATFPRPFRFWINDDNDQRETVGSDIPNPANRLANAQDDRVNGVRDLVDFFPVYLNIGHLLQVLSNDYNHIIKCRLRHAEGALNMVYTDLRPDQAHSYLTATNVARSLGGERTYRIGDLGYFLDDAFVDKIKNEGKGIILVEARTNTVEPLILEVRENGIVIAEVELPLSITPVEQMFRQKNLIRATYVNRTAGFPDRLADSDVPNEPDTNDKNLVFLHGYNVNPQQARGWLSEMFKRFYSSGSRAKFYGVNYDGYEGQLGGSLTPNLQTNIVHAFEAAPHLSTFLNGLEGTNILAGHSLGNMVILGAMNHTNTSIDTFFMIDAALAIEALDGGATRNTNMVHPEWSEHTNQVWASEWHSLFATNDHRSTLTWRDRLANFGTTAVYNFYSSGEEVLRQHVGNPPSITAAVFDQAVLNALLGVEPAGTFTWAWQEKLKGRCLGNWILGSSHGGWGFNLYYCTIIGETTFPPTPSTTAQLTSSQLKTNPVFDMTVDTVLFGTNGSAYAQTNRNRILSDAIPALTLPAGANSVTNLDFEAGEKRNFDMQNEFKNGWPLVRTSEEASKWHHSDVREVSYTYIYKLFDEIVNGTNLK